MLTEEKKQNKYITRNKLLQTATTVNIHQMHSKKQTATINIDNKYAHQADNARSPNEHLL